jgi:hypothetical protein
LRVSDAALRESPIMTRGNVFMCAIYGSPWAAP